jgi:hypothetical protein
MKKRVLAALQARAERYCGDAASILDYVCAFLASGGRMEALAELLAADLSHSVSRSFLSWTLNHVAHDAKRRLQAARRDAQLIVQSKRQASQTASGGDSECSNHELARDIIAA